MLFVTDGYGTATATHGTASVGLHDQQLGIRGYLKLKKAELVQALEGISVVAP